MHRKLFLQAGIGIEDILEQVVEYVPAPSGDIEAPLKALILTLFTIVIGGRFKHPCN